MSMSLTKSFSLSLNDCKDPGKRHKLQPTSAHAQLFKSCIFILLSSLFHLTLSDVSPVDTLSVSSLRDEVCARVLVCIRDQAEVNWIIFLHYIQY